VELIRSILEREIACHILELGRRAFSGWRLDINLSIAEYLKPSDAQDLKAAAAEVD
jgi:hypothetical protein